MVLDKLHMESAFGAFIGGDDPIFYLRKILRIDVALYLEFAEKAHPSIYWLYARVRVARRERSTNSTAKF